MNAILLPLIVLCGVTTGMAATITWDGGGGNSSWQTEANWSNDALPGINDDVILNAGGGLVVTSSASVTIRSVQASNSIALTAGVFRVTSGDSILQGQVHVSGNPTLSASGPATRLVLPNALNLDRAGLEALGGAQFFAPMVPRFNKGSGCATVSWRASGANSALHLPGLTNLAGADCGNLLVQALDDGWIVLSSVVSLAEGMAAFLAEGTNSRVDLSSLQNAAGVLDNVAFEARNGGTMSIPQMHGGKTVTVAIRSGGMLPVGQLAELEGFTVVGTNLNFTSLTNLGHGSISVTSNAVVTATNLVRHNGALDCYTGLWHVSGPGSVLDFSSLTNLVGADCGSRELRASSGATFRLTGLRAISEGTLKFSAHGSGSLIDLANLNRSDATQRIVALEALDSGTIQMPLYTGTPRTFLILENNGNIPTENMRELSGFQVSGMNVHFAALTNVLHGHITVANGAIVTLPLLVRHDHSGTCVSTVWEVRDAGSSLDLSSLTYLSGPSCGSLIVNAENGGRAVLNSVQTVANGTLTFSAAGNGSAIELPLLANVHGGRVVSLIAADSGEIIVPLLEGNTNVFVSVNDDGILPIAQFARLHGFSVNGMNVVFGALTNLASGSVIVSGGGVATAPHLVSHVDPAFCGLSSWQATGPGSVLDFSSLTNLVGPQCGALSIQAKAGGNVRMGGLSRLGEGGAAFLSDGLGSALDLSGLRNSDAVSHNISFEARNNGSVELPEFEGGETVTLVIRSGGSFDTTHLKLLRSLTVSGTSLSLAGLTNLFAGNLIVEQGAVLSLPGVFNHDQSTGCPLNAWSVTGSGSVLELLSLTNLVGSGCGSLVISATAGGLVNISNLVTVADGTVAFVVDGINSTINLSSLRESRADENVVSFEARNAGEIAMPSMLGGSSVWITIKTNGVIPTSRLSTLRSVTAIGANIFLDGLTNIDRGTFTVLDGGTVTAPSLREYVKGDWCDSTTWLARGPGSLLSLPQLQRMDGGNCVPLEIVATNGGQVLLNALTNGTAWLTMASSGAGSIIALPSLLNLIHTASASRLTATNGGGLALPAGPAFFSGVSLEIAGGTPGLPLTRIAATNLVMRGVPWRSYWIEYRNPEAPQIPWAFYGRVPLTNDFQVIAPPATGSVEYRAWEFVAEPALLDLHIRQATNVQLTLYAPSGSIRHLLANTNLLSAPWQAFDTVVMTNTFRILQPRPSNGKSEFFRAEP
ncbi:MAG TPA: hypothetical protein VEH04_15590 [Verrucomicrobiae bacterium]|nr:hypothetical protein [Verrucomicrobiae bacterium]